MYEKTMIGKNLSYFRIEAKLGSCGMGGWAAASVGIAQAVAAPKKMIPITHRNGEVPEKAASGCPGDEFLGLGKSSWKPLVVSRRK